MEEEWRSVRNYEGYYEVSNMGRVKTVRRTVIGYKNGVKYESDIRPKILKCKKTAVLSKDGVSKNVPIKYLVAQSFLGCKETRPKLIHIDGNTNNVCAYNLKVIESTSLSGELWKFIPGFDNRYQISNYGRVKRCARVETYVRSDSGKECSRTYDERMMRLFEDEDGYLEIDLVIEGKHSYRRIHQLVANAFLEHSSMKQINHIDGNKKNNHVSNLEWCTTIENIQHAIDTGLRKSPTKGIYKGPVKLKCVENGKCYSSIREASTDLNISYSYLSDRINEDKACHGYTFLKI